MKYDLFLSDFDGTLLRSDGTVSENTKKTVARYRERGGIFAVCTGRGLLSILPRVKELGLENGLVVASQGAVIADIATGRLLKHTVLPCADAVEILRYFEASDQHIHIYTIDGFYANRRDGMLESYEGIYGRRATVVEDEPLSSKTQREGLHVIKILVMIEPERRDGLFAAAQEALGGRYFVTCSSPWLVEVLPKGENKGAAVRFLSEYYAIPREKIAAAGDQKNDLPMLEAAGGRFAVENAEDELKKRAALVPSNDEDGVAYALAVYAMGETL